MFLSILLKMLITNMLKEEWIFIMHCRAKFPHATCWALIEFYGALLSRRSGNLHALHHMGNHVHIMFRRYLQASSQDEETICIESIVCRHKVWGMSKKKPVWADFATHRPLRRGVGRQTCRHGRKKEQIKWFCWENNAVCLFSTSARGIPLNGIIEVTSLSFQPYHLRIWSFIWKMKGLTWSEV